MVERLVRNEKVRGSNPLTSKAKRGGIICKSAEREFRMDLGLVGGGPIPLPPRISVGIDIKIRSGVIKEVFCTRSA